MHLTLKLMNGEVLEHQVNSPVVTIGRSQKCTVHVPHEGMSRQHCQIEEVEGEFFVTDLNSTNGVLIDGQKIEPGKRVKYQTYLNLSFGAVVSLQIEIREAPVRTLPSSLNTAPKTNSSDQAAKTIKGKSEKISAKSGRPKEKKSLQFWVINIFAVLILFGAAYWYFQKENTDMQAPMEFIDDMESPSRGGRKHEF